MNSLQTGKREWLLIMISEKKLTDSGGFVGLGTQEGSVLLCALFFSSTIFFLLFPLSLGSWLVCFVNSGRVCGLPSWLLLAPGL